MVTATRDLEGEPGVDGAETEFAALGAAARTGDRVEQPSELGAGEIWIKQKPRPRADHRLVPRLAQLCTKIRCTTVLPDDGACDGRPRGAVPEHGRLALVGDADRGDVARRDAGGLHHLIKGRRLRRPDLLRIVLDLARSREMLREFALRDGDDTAVRVEQHGSGARRALVEGEDVAAHASVSALVREANQSVTACAASGGRCRPSLLRLHSTSSAVQAHSDARRYSSSRS